MSQRPTVFAILITVFISGLIITASADIPKVMNYQGKVTDTGGTPVSDGTYSMQFRIYDAENAGNLEWDSGSVPVDVSGGVFEVMLGESPQDSIDLAFDEDYWLETVVDGDVQSPRVKLGSVGYAYMASGLVPGTVVEGSVSSGTNAVLKVRNNSTADLNYGVIGESNSTDGRGVYGKATQTSGFTHGVHGWSASTNGCGVYGNATMSTGITYGVYGRSSSTSGRGVYGLNNETSGVTYGVYGETHSTSGRGVYGVATQSTGSTNGVHGSSNSTSGRGVYGIATQTSGATYGVYGVSCSTDGRGVYGLADQSTGTTYGVYGQSFSTTGVGVYGLNSQSTGTTYGVYGWSSSADGVGVYGINGGTTGPAYGVYGRTSSTGGRGVYGVNTRTNGFTYGVYGESNSTDGRGVYGISTQTTGSAIGVRGESNSTDGSGVFGYNAQTTGTTYGVYGSSNSTSGRGIFGLASQTSGFTSGVYGENNSTQGRGVYGITTQTTGTTYGVYGRSNSTSGRGVYGTAARTTGITYGVYGVSYSPDGWGVYGQNTSDGWAGGFEGNVHVMGNTVVDDTLQTSELQVNGRITLPDNDATPNMGSGVIEIGSASRALRLDGNEIITNSGELLHIQKDNGGDLSVDNGTLFVDASAGMVGVGTTNPAYTLQVGENGDGTEARANAWNLLSSKKYKSEITLLEDREYHSILKQLVDTDVVRYHFYRDENKAQHLGIIAEEAPRDIVTRDGEALSLSDYCAFLLAATKAQQERIEALEAEVILLRNR